MPDLLSRLRQACAEVAQRAAHVRVNGEAIQQYAAMLPLQRSSTSEPDPESHLTTGTREQLSAFWLTLDAINFGSGWFPTLRKRDRRSGYYTIAAAMRDRFVRDGPWSAAALSAIGPAEIAGALGQDPDHELMVLFARSLNDLGDRVSADHGGRFGSPTDAVGASAEALVELLARWDCFADSSAYDELAVPFLKRAQIAAFDLARAGVLDAPDLGRLTMFADNLVPHVLRLDGLLVFDRRLVARVDRGELIEHGSAEEVEIRACALHAVELIVGTREGADSNMRAADVDQLLWMRGQEPRYKASPRHRSRCTAY